MELFALLLHPLPNIQLLKVACCLLKDFIVF